MSKIIRLFLHQGFTPLDKESFHVGTCIEFDCYIQRFNGFVIVLEAGTFLDEKIYEKLSLKDLQIFVKNSDYPKYTQYKKEHENSKDYILDDYDIEKEIGHIYALNKELRKAKSSQEKLRTLYFRGKNFKCLV